MKGTHSVIGFTLGEIGLVLLLGVLVIGTRDLPENREAVVNADSLHAVIAVLRADSVRHAAERMELERLRKLRSRQTPTCTERGVAQGFLTPVYVLGEGRYRVGNRVMNIGAVRTHFAADIERGLREGCRHQIDVHYIPSLTSREFNNEHRRLQRDFYTRVIDP
jgi:hypothetical protein